MKIEKNQLHTTEEVAEFLKVSIITIKRYIAENKISSIKLNGLRRIKGDAILEILSLDSQK